MAAAWKRRWGKARSPEHCLPKTGSTAWVFTARTLSSWGPGRKFSAINLMFCQEMALAGSCHPCSSRIHRQVRGCLALAGLGAALQGCWDSVRSESLLVCPLPWQGDGGRHDGEEGSPPGMLVQGPNLPKSDEGDKEKESSRMRMQWVAWRSSGDRRGHLLSRGAALPTAGVTYARLRCAGGYATGGRDTGSL